VSVKVRVPASTANIGSGYDSFGLALSLYNTVAAELAPEGTWSVQVIGEGSGRVRGPDNLVAVSMRRLFHEAGCAASARLTCENNVPFGRGLGSSSAAIVGGLVAANALVDRPLDADELFRLAAELEGHPDNVAAALLGGFTICWAEKGTARVAHLEPALGLATVCVVSDARLSTKRARSLLPDEVPHRDAAYDVGRAGLLAAGIALGRADLVRPGMNDRLHEPYRATAVTDLVAVEEALLAAGADGASLSGAGPSVIGLVTGADDAEALARAEDVARRAETLLRGVTGRRVPQAVAIDRRGAVAIG
jgi:homoserine kinase